MTSRYRVEYQLKTHRRDELIEWIKGLLAVPFVLHAVRTPSRAGEEARVSGDARRRYAEIFFDLERMIEEQIHIDRVGAPSESSRLRQLVPSVGRFFTPLPLERAFYVVDERRSISLRRLVAPSFNDIRIVLNMAQVMAVARGELKLVTFDGDVTLYEDGQSLVENSKVIPLLLELLRRGMYVGVVTAAGYAEESGEKYEQRLAGLISAVRDAEDLTDDQKRQLLLMGGESNYLFRYCPTKGGLKWVEPEEWYLDEVRAWSEADISHVLDIAEKTLKTSQSKLNLPAKVIRKERAVGIVPNPGESLCREQLEELVLSCQRRLDMSQVARKIWFCAFNGGADVWVDIGDKCLGVKSLQRYLGGIHQSETLHIGDQFASLGANDFKARLAANTVWIANPQETVDVLHDLMAYLDERDDY